MLADPAHDRLGPGPVTGSRFANLFPQRAQVLVRRIEGGEAFELGSQGGLEQLRRGEVAPFELVVEVFRQVGLHSRHTPNYTPDATEQVVPLRVKVVGALPLDWKLAWKPKLAVPLGAMVAL
jgi:hypothetical protein